MVTIIIGKQGSGKTTKALEIAKNYKNPVHIVAGDINTTDLKDHDLIIFEEIFFENQESVWGIYLLSIISKASNIDMIFTTNTNFSASEKLEGISGIQIIQL